MKSKRKLRKLTKISDHWDEEVSSDQIGAMQDDTNATFLATKSVAQDALEDTEKRMDKIKALKDMFRSRNDHTLRRNEESIQQSVAFLKETDEGTVERILKTHDTRLLSVRKHGSSFFKELKRQRKGEIKDESGRDRKEDYQEGRKMKEKKSEV